MALLGWIEVYRYLCDVDVQLGTLLDRSGSGGIWRLLLLALAKARPSYIEKPRDTWKKSIAEFVREHNISELSVE